MGISNKAILKGHASIVVLRENAWHTCVYVFQWDPLFTTNPIYYTHRVQSHDQLSTGGLLSYDYGHDYYVKDEIV